MALFVLAVYFLIGIGAGLSGYVHQTDLAEDEGLFAQCSPFPVVWGWLVLFCWPAVVGCIFYWHFVNIENDAVAERKKS